MEEVGVGSWVDMVAGVGCRVMPTTLMPTCFIVCLAVCVCVCVK